jgi:endonuclease IV
MQDEEAILYDIVLKRAKRAVIAITGKSGIERMLIHLDDRKGHNSARTMERLDEFQVTVSAHPPYFLDISSSDFFSFSRSKDAMRGR